MKQTTTVEQMIETQNLGANVKNDNLDFIISVQKCPDNWLPFFSKEHLQ